MYICIYIYIYNIPNNGQSTGEKCKTQWKLLFRVWGLQCFDFSSAGVGQGLAVKGPALGVGLAV